jgi:hypothetical protein
MEHISFLPMPMMLILWEKTSILYRKKTEALSDASQEVGLETKYMLMSH